VFTHAETAILVPTPRLFCFITGEQRGFAYNVEPLVRALSNFREDATCLPNASAYQSKTNKARLALKGDT